MFVIVYVYSFMYLYIYVYLCARSSIYRKLIQLMNIYIYINYKMFFLNVFDGFCFSVPYHGVFLNVLSVVLPGKPCCC